MFLASLAAKQEFHIVSTLHELFRGQLRFTHRLGEDKGTFKRSEYVVCCLIVLDRDAWRIFQVCREMDKWLGPAGFRQFLSWIFGYLPAEENSIKACCSC
jgi:hypothetical protein